MTDPNGYGWKPPIAKTRVNLILGANASPYVRMELDGNTGRWVPEIWMTCCSASITDEEERREIQAVAAHEGFHVFTHSQSDMINPSTGLPTIRGKLWAWYDEAMAVFMESDVIAGNNAWYCFGPQWVDHPHAALDYDEVRTYYRWVFFVRYLCRRHGANFLHSVWHNRAKADDSPFDVISRLSGKAIINSSADFVGDVFTSEFCVDSYFIWHEEPDIFNRFGERALAYSFKLDPGESQTMPIKVPGWLGCSYYRICTPRSLNSLNVCVRKGELKSNALKVLGFSVNQNGNKKQIFPFTRNGDCKFVIIDQTLLGSDTDHIVIMIVNCEMPGTRHRTQIPILKVPNEPVLEISAR